MQLEPGASLLSTMPAATASDTATKITGVWLSTVAEKALMAAGVATPTSMSSPWETISLACMSLVDISAMAFWKSTVRFSPST